MCLSVIIAQAYLARRHSFRVYMTRTDHPNQREPNTVRTPLHGTRWWGATISLVVRKHILRISSPKSRTFGVFNVTM